MNEDIDVRLNKLFYQVQGLDTDTRNEIIERKNEIDELRNYVGTVDEKFKHIEYKSTTHDDEIARLEQSITRISENNKTLNLSHSRRTRNGNFIYLGFLINSFITT